MATEKTMTKREFLNAIIKLTTDPEVSFTDEEMEALGTFAENELTAIEAEAKRRADKAREKNSDLLNALFGGVLTTKPQSSVAIAEACGVSTSKINGVMRALVESGRVVKGSDKFDKRTLVTYALPIEIVVEDDLVEDVTAE